jgi:hypothetical protein
MRREPGDIRSTIRTRASAEEGQPHSWPSGAPGQLQLRLQTEGELRLLRAPILVLL